MVSLSVANSFSLNVRVVVGKVHLRPCMTQFQLKASNSFTLNVANSFSLNGLECTQGVI